MADPAARAHRDGRPRRTRSATVTGETPALTAAGRTDAGAHAHGQVAGMHARARLGAGRAASRAQRRAAGRPRGSRASRRGRRLHARRDAVERTYRYLVVCRDGRAPVTRRNAWTVRGPLDIDAMRAAAAHLVGRHDFAAFGSAPRAGGSTVRTVTSRQRRPPCTRCRASGAARRRRRSSRRSIDHGAARTRSCAA